MADREVAGVPTGGTEPAPDRARGAEPPHDRAPGAEPGGAEVSEPEFAATAGDAGLLGLPVRRRFTEAVRAVPASLRAFLG